MREGFRRFSILLYFLIVYACVAQGQPPRPGTATTLTITANNTPVVSVPARSAVTLSATVISGAASVSPGVVNFCNASATYCTGSNLVGTAQLTSAGSATYKFVPGPGTHSYKAVFVGTNTFASSTSAAESLIVIAATGPVTTTVGIQASGGQGDYSLLGTVATNGQASPTGQISFLDTSNANYVLGTDIVGPTGSDGISFRTSYSLPLTDATPGTAGEGFVLTGDFNGDGIPDILLTSSNAGTYSVLLGKGDGTFTTKTYSAPMSDNELVALGDFNGDGKLDFVVQAGGKLAVYLGNGDGTFTAGQVVPTLTSTALVTADFNGDGSQDLATIETDNAGAFYLRIYFGNGDGTFAGPATQTTLPASLTGLVTADFNADGRPDLVAYTYLGAAPTLLLGNGDGTFTIGPQISVGTAQNPSINAAVAGDLNGDGKIDLIFAATQAPATVLLGNGDGTFTKLAQDPNLSQQTGAVILADFNGDGIPDLVLPDQYGGKTDVFLGRGDGTFIPDSFSPGQADFGSPSLAIADFDGDGQADIVEVFSDLRGLSSGDFDRLDVLLSQAPNTAAAYANNISPVGSGFHYVEASYPGDQNNLAGVSTTIALLAQQVPTNLTLTVSPSGGDAVGQPVTLTASLDQFFAQNHYASGMVSFFSNGKNLGTAAVGNNGLATLTTSALLLGTDNLRAVYPGDTNFVASNSSTLSYTVTAQVGQTITFPPLATPAYAGTSVLLTATASSGLPVTYTVLSGPAYISALSGAVLTYTGAGAVVVEADQTGSAAYTPASPVQDTITTSLLTEPVGTTSSVVSTVVTFSSPGILGSIGILTQGGPNLDFVAVPGGSCGVGMTYAAGQSCIVNFAFDPRLPGIRNGGIVMTSTSGALLANSYIYGIGVGPLVNYVPGVQSSFVSGITGPTGLAFDGSGNFFYVDYHAHQVRELFASTNFQTSGVVGSGLVSPESLAIDGSGNLFVTENNVANDVVELFAVGNYSSQVRLGGGFSEPAGIALDSNGNVFVADNGAKAVKEITASSGYSTVLNIGNGFVAPVGVAVDSKANVFVADSGASRVVEILAGSGYTQSFTIPGVFPFATAVAVNASGNVFITSDDNTLKEAFAATGYSTNGTLSNNAGLPDGIALDGYGNIYLANYYAGAITKLDFADPPSLTFLPTVIGSTSSDSPQTITQINNGTANLVFTVPQSGNNPSITSSFTIAAISTCPQLAPRSASASLAIGATCTDAVSFVPVATGPISGKLITTDNLNGPGSSQTIILNGTGTAVAASLVFSVPNHIFGDPPFAVSASSNSPGPITYSVVSGPATISGSIVTVTGTGSVTLLASQAASGVYAAGSQTATFTVSAAAPTIAFAVANHTFGDPPFMVSATSNSGGSITYSVVSGPATISGSTVTLTGPGTVVLQANQAAAVNFSAGSQTATFQVSDALPQIAFVVGNHTFGGAPFAVLATSNSAGTFTYSVVSGPATLSGSQVTLTGAGTVTLLASQAAFGAYAAGSQSATFTVGKQAQTVNFVAPVSPVNFGNAPITLTATASSGLPVAFRVLSGPATVSGNILTLTAAGPVVVAADQAGNSNYGAAPEVTRTVVVLGRLVSIGFTAAPNPVFLRNPLTLAVTLSATGGVPTGTVLFLDGTTPLGTVGVSGSAAALVTSSLTLGLHSITAIYSGDGIFAQLTSSPVIVTVQDFGLATNNPSVTIDHGGTATYNLVLSSVGGIGLASTVNLALSGEPNSSEIVFTPQSVPSGSGSTGVVLVIHTPNYPTGPFSSVRMAARSEISLAFFALGALLLPFRRRLRMDVKRGKLLSLVLFFSTGTIGLLALSGCGSGWRTQNWTMQVTASSGQLTRTTTLTLTSECKDGRTACPIENP